MNNNDVKEITGKELRRMQLIQLDMLVEFDRVCRKHGIKYSMDGGTMLGAVRHKGYIPWDDDADIMMLREEYNKFKRVASELNPDICWLQDHETDPEYRWGYSKLRRTGTTFIRAGQEHIKCKTGVFIDIFPHDDVPKSVIGQVIQDCYCYCLRKVLWSEVARKTERSLFWRLWFKLLSFIPVDFVFSRINKMASKSRNDSSHRARTLMFMAYARMNKGKVPLKELYSMPKEWYLDLVDYEFEGVKLLGTRDYDARLRHQYGDYMKLPPENERVAHAPVSSYDFGGLHMEVIK